MSTIAVEILPVTYVKPCPDADELEIAIINGHVPVVVRKGDYKQGLSSPSHRRLDKQPQHV